MLWLTCSTQVNSLLFILTFRNVALSLVTIDGLTLMLSCIIDVKLG